MNLVMLGDDPLIVTRQPPGLARREYALRDLIFASPAMLPLTEIDPGMGKVMAVAKELNIPGAGRLDMLLIDQRDRLVVVECKLWRNPQARREVIAQILDYARALAGFGYEDLQREISAVTRRKGNVLFELARTLDETLDEARFVDQVTRDLKAGRFLLLIVGDGITEGTQRIGEYLRAQPGLAFDFGLVEMAEYRFHDPATGTDRAILQPRLLARTSVIERSVIRNEASGIIVEDVADARITAGGIAGGSSPNDRADTSFQLAWLAFAEKLIASMNFDDPGQPPPRYGGLGWLRVPLPQAVHISLWRSKNDELVGAFVRFATADALGLYDRLLEEQAAIDAEFVQDGLDAPEWERDTTTAMILMLWSAALPWDATEEDAQIELLSQTANRFVSSLRPRLNAPVE